MYDSLKTKSMTMLSVGKMCFFRLLCSPLITYLICLALHLGSIETTAAVLINACPVASTCTIFAKKYKGDTSFASNCVCYSTFCSLLTLCFVCFVLL
ncbi:MAG: AEC family transporter, partial [Bacilli bacterium]